MASIEELFNAEIKRYEVKKDLTDFEKIEAQSFKDVNGPEGEERERVSREAEIKDALKALNSKLRSTKNVKNASATAARINAEKATARKKMRAQITVLEVALKDINMEREGSKVTTNTLSTSSQ